MSGWDDWDANEPPDVTGHPRTLAEVPPPAATTPGRRAQRRARKRDEQHQRQQSVATSRARKRRALTDLEHAPGLAVLVVAVIVVGVVVWLRLSSSSDEGEAAADSGVQSTSASAIETSPLELDPHAGVRVLNPSGMPSAPGEPDPATGSDPVSAAIAFAAQACALNGGESRADYEARLAALSTPQVAAAWEGGSAQQIACMQLAGTATTQSESAATVSVSGVQVYADAAAADGLRAYRWSASIELTTSNGAWAVSGA